jgi:hypothetical protein
VHYRISPIWMVKVSNLEVYGRFKRRTGVDALVPTNAVEMRLAKPFGDAARIHPVPFVMTTADRDTLADATRQRALALRHFFTDVAIGGATFLDQLGGPARFDRILASHGVDRVELRRCWAQRALTDVCFTYAPDLLRVEDGTWRVLEDNIGCIGGLADSFYCARAYLAAVGIDPGDETPDLCRGVRAFLDEADPSAVAVELGCDGTVDGEVLHESARRRTLLERLGLAIGDRTTVSHVVNFTPARHFADEFARGRLAMLNPPYVELLGDKRLLPYVDQMVTFYLRELPMLRALPTRTIQGRDDLTIADTGVVKHGCGAQGTSVYFLDDAAERIAALNAVASSLPWSFVVQELASVRGEQPHARLELRPFAIVAGDRICTSNTPSARLPRADRRRANLGHGASYAAVLIEGS